LPGRLDDRYTFAPDGVDLPRPLSENPKDGAGTAMNFIGLKKKQDRSNIMAICAR
jgi:hypothetical protein